jgi:hypothetical protein
MRYRLRTLLIVLTLGPPVLAGAWVKLVEWRRPAVTWDEAIRKAQEVQTRRPGLLAFDHTSATPNGR